LPSSAPAQKEEAPTCRGARGSRALASPGDRCRVGDVDRCRQPRRGPLFRGAPPFHLPQRGAPASRSRRLVPVVEHRVRGVARARSYVAIAGRRDVSQRFGRRLALLRPARQLHLHLEYEVDLERVVEVKRISTTAVISVADAIEQALPPLGRPGALDILLACRLLWRPPCGRSPTRRRG
jgi:hypothetical protein